MGAVPNGISFGARTRQMSQVYFNSELHLGHDNVLGFHDNFRAKRLGVKTIKEHDEMIYDLWNDTVRKHDIIYILGDVGFTISRIKQLPGHKKLILGNHDQRHAAEYLEVFDDIIGTVKYKQHWISHFPIHESELWNKPVIHGHTHSNGVADERYINLSIEMTKGKPINFQDIRNGTFTTYDKVNKDFEQVEW